MAPPVPPLLSRTLEATVAVATRQFPVDMLTGPRQVGKTTLLMAMAEGEPASDRQRYVVNVHPPHLDGEHGIRVG